jgi:adenylate kinase
MRLVLLGPPGAGKGTQAKALSQEWNLVHISTGDLFRYHLAHQTELGQAAKNYMESGRLVPDDITEAMLKNRIEQEDVRRSEGFVLDGFPRTVPQGQALDALLTARGERLNRAILIHVPTEVLLERLVGRRTCNDCKASYHVEYHPPKVAGICDLCGGALIQRDDDRLETVRIRLQVYHEETEPLVAFYRASGLLATVNGDQDPASVTLATIDAAKGGTS